MVTGEAQFESGCLVVRGTSFESQRNNPILKFSLVCFTRACRAYEYDDVPSVVDSALERRRAAEAKCQHS